MSTKIFGLEVFDEYAYSMLTELIDYKVNMFNGMTRGALILESGANQGDFTFETYYKKIEGLVRRRNPRGTGTVTEKNLEHLMKITVKVGAGTHPVRLDKSRYRWLQRNPEEAAAVVAQQLSEDIIADMINPGVAALYAAMSQETEIVYDGTAGSLDLTALMKGARLMGDRSSDIKVWLTHSQPLFDLFENNLANDDNLFEFGTVNIKTDGFGRVFVIADLPSLIEEDGIGVGDDKYHVFGLGPGALRIEMNNDFDTNIEETNGYENIKRTIQHEWSYQIGIRGFKWNTAEGNEAPTDAALASSDNWIRQATSHKDLPGVIVEVGLA